MESIVYLIVLAGVLPFCICQEKVLLSNVKTITLHSGKFTTARRGSPISQLRCVPALSACSSLPTAVQCYNKGTDGLDIQWRCEAQLPKSIQFDNTEISCEGYDHPADKYILVGSCGLTYSLKPTGAAQPHNNRHHHVHHSGELVITRVHATPTVPIVSGVLLAVVLLGLALLAYRICACNSTTACAAAHDDDGPPSYYSRSHYKPLAGYAEESPAVSSGAGGFWTGAAVGGAAGLLIGSSAAAAASSSMPHGYHACEEVTVVYASSDYSSDDGDGDNGMATAFGYASTMHR